LGSERVRRGADDRDLEGDVGEGRGAIDAHQLLGQLVGVEIAVAVDRELNGRAQLVRTGDQAVELRDPRCIGEHRVWVGR